MTVTRKWSLLAAVLVLAILAAGWFLLVAPKRTEAAEIKDQTASQEQANASLVQKLNVLKAQQADLPKQRAILANLRTNIPDNPSLPSLVRDLTAAGRKVGVSIDSMAPSPPVAVVVAPTVVAAPPAAETTSETEGASESASETGTTPAPVAAAPAAPSLYQVPLALDVTGSYFELEQFVNRLERLKRSFLVSGFTLAPAAGTESSAGATVPNAAAPGDLTLTLQGRVFLAPAPVATTTQPATVAPATAGQ